MKQGRRYGLSAEQRTDIWHRWKAGESLHEIGRAFGKDHGSVQFLLSQHGASSASYLRASGAVRACGLPFAPRAVAEPSTSGSHADDDALPPTPANERAVTSRPDLARPVASNDKSQPDLLQPVGIAVPRSALFLRTGAKPRCCDRLFAAIAGTSRCCSPDLLEGSFEKIQLHLLAAEQTL
jgi:hypothetical protein